MAESYEQLRESRNRLRAQALAISNMMASVVPDMAGATLEEAVRRVVHEHQEMINTCDIHTNVPGIELRTACAPCFTNLHDELETAQGLVVAQAKVLTETARALRGPEPDGVMYSHHDLAIRVTTLKSGVRRVIDELRDKGWRFDNGSTGVVKGRHLDDWANELEKLL